MSLAVSSLVISATCGSSPAHLSRRPPHPRQSSHLAPRPNMRATMKHVIVVRFDIAKNCPIKVRGGRNRKTSPGIEQRDSLLGLGVERACTRNLKLHKRPPMIIHRPALDISFGQPKLRQLLKRQ